MNSLRIAFTSLALAARHPRVWLAAWLLVTLPAAFLVLPVMSELRTALDHHPGATFGLNQHLDMDFARQHPEAAVRAGGAFLLVLLGWTFLGGGILASVGVGRKFSFSGLLAEGGRLFSRNLRAVLLGLVLALLLFWGVAALDGWLRQTVLYGADPEPLDLFGWSTPLLSPRMGLEALQWIYGLLFVLLLFGSKMARARLCLYDRRSSFLAWSRALGTMLRRPLRTFLVVVTLLACWLAVSFGLGFAMERAGENLWILLGIGQAAVVWTQIVLVACFLSARRLVAEADSRPEVIVEPTVVLPRRERQVQRKPVHA